jgi:predicted RecB family endonuclease
MEEKDIDDLIMRFRNHSENDIEHIQKMLEPIILKFSIAGKRNDKIERFLKELIAKKETIDKVKVEPTAGHSSYTNYPQT